MTTINPKLLALAAQLDAAHECARRVEAQQNEDDDDIEIAAAKRLCAEAYAQISKLEMTSRGTSRVTTSPNRSSATFSRLAASQRLQLPKRQPKGKFTMLRIFAIAGQNKCS